MIPLILVWLRAAGLIGQAVALGGAAFAVVVLPRARTEVRTRAVDLTLTLVALGASIAAIAQTGTLAALAAELAGERTWPVAALLGSTVGLSGLARIACALIVAGMALVLRRAPLSRARRVALVIAAVLLSATGTLATHAVGWVGSSVWTVIVSIVHQAGAGVWVGGLVCAAVLAFRRDGAAPEAWLRPFSALAATAVGALALTGAAMSILYIRTPGAAIGTSYGAMVLTKVTLFAALLILAALNHRALHGRLASSGHAFLLRRRLEVEAGVAVVAIFLAASIGAAPPAIDVGADRVTLAEIQRVLTPQWPRLTSPSLAELTAVPGFGDASAARGDAETEWSEFGHHVAGMFIITMGVLAILERTGRAPWARHWPLLLIGLTVFVAYNMDPEGWQTGRVGFWQQLLGLEVLQHRILLLLTAMLGLAEWRVRSGRNPGSPWRYVFPLVFIASGTLLLSHAHELSNVKAAFLMELTHLPMGLVVLVAGWARWLELRLPPGDGERAGRLWGPALLAFGLLLVAYREG